MSSVGDIIAISNLAWTLYRECYMVARGAPQEFRLLVDDVQTMSGSLKILVEEIDNPDSVLIQAGEDRVRMVNEMVAWINVTLTELRKVADKYKILESGASKRKKLWARLSWSMEFSSVDSLRSKLVYHNTVLNLLLTSVGNSSLSRIESTTKVVEANIVEIRSYIQASARKGPAISATGGHSDGDVLRTINAAFMKNAEILQPWSSIGIDRWIHCGRWWLLKAQMGLYGESSSDQPLSAEAYVSLLKGSWILADVASQHPQLPFLDSATHYELQLLSAEVKQELKRINELTLIVPNLSLVEERHLEIWESNKRGPSLLPGRTSTSAGNGSNVAKFWAVKGEHVYYQRFALYLWDGRLDGLLPCVVLLLVNGTTDIARLLIQDQNGDLLTEILIEPELQVELTESSLVFKVGEITPASSDDVTGLFTMLDAIKYYLSFEHKRIDHDDLKGFILLFAVKESCHPLIMTWLAIGQEPATSDSKQSALSVALDLMSELPLGHRQLPASRFGWTNDADGFFSWAIEYNLESVLRLLGHKGVDLGMKYSQSFLSQEIVAGDSQHSSLQKAATCGHSALVRILVSSGADVDEISHADHITPLWFAAREGHEDIVRTLLQGGADVNFYDEGTALSVAVAGGHKDIVRLLLEAGADVDPEHADDEGPLHEAAAQGNSDTVRLLLKAGADVNRQHVDSGGPLHVAAERGYVDVLQILLENGADPAAQSGLNRLLPIHYAAKSGLQQALEVILRSRPDLGIDAEAGFGHTALHVAVQAGWEDLVQFLLEKGADISKGASGDHHRQAIHYAALRGDASLVELLLDWGSSIDATDIHGLTPLFLAVEKADIDIVKLLLGKGADVNKRLESHTSADRERYVEGETPLYTMYANGEEYVVGAILRKWGGKIFIESHPRKPIVGLALDRAREHTILS